MDGWQALGQSEGGEDELFDEALAEFYAKEHWFPKLFFLPALLTRKFMRSFWYSPAPHASDRVRVGVRAKVRLGLVLTPSVLG